MTELRGLFEVFLFRLWKCEGGLRLGLGFVGWWCLSCLFWGCGVLMVGMVALERWWLEGMVLTVVSFSLVGVGDGARRLGRLGCVRESKYI